MKRGKKSRIIRVIVAFSIVLLLADTALMPVIAAEKKDKAQKKDEINIVLPEETQAAEDTKVSEEEPVSTEASTNTNTSEDTEKSADTEAPEDTEKPSDTEAPEDTEQPTDEENSADDETAPGTEDKADAETSEDTKEPADADASEDTKESADADASEDTKEPADADALEDDKTAAGTENGAETEASEDSEAPKDTEEPADGETSTETEETGTEENLDENGEPLPDAKDELADEELTEKELLEEIEVKEEEGFFDLFSSFSANKNNETPTIENGGWDDYSCDYVYTWDVTDNATKWGVWGGNGNLQGNTYEDTNNNDVSNKVGVYCDNDNVYVYIQYASLFQGVANGYDYNISIDGVNTKFNVWFDDGTKLDPHANKSEGTYGLTIRHGDGSISGQDVLGATGSIVIHDGNVNNQMEICIPLSAIRDQNGNVNTDYFSKAEFFSPNIMMWGQTVGCAGAGNSPIGFFVITTAFLACFFVSTQLKSEGKLRKVNA